MLGIGREQRGGLRLRQVARRLRLDLV
jgi:hypothetical protein